MNGIFLHLLLREVGDEIIGRYVEELLIKDRFVQIILDKKAILASLYSQAPALLLGQKLPGFEKLTAFGDAVLGSRIISADMEHFTPAVKLLLEKSSYGRTIRSELVISLYKDAPNIRIESTEMKRRLYDRFIEKPPKRPVTELNETTIAHGDDLTQLLNQYEGIDKNLARELNAANLPQLKAILAGAPYRPRLVSVLPLKISLFVGDFINEYGDLNELLNDWCKKFLAVLAETDARAKKAESVKKLRKKLEKLKKNAVAEKDLETLRTSGELILANLAGIKRGMSEVTLYDHYRQEDAVLGLDPSKSPQENALVYFDKYKKAKRGRPIILKQIKEIEKEINRLEKSSSTVAAGPVLSTADGQVTKAAVSKPGKVIPKPFREFPLLSGSIVFVGKNARSNENLTFKFARPDDYFFHARGIEGAHTIMKAKTPKGQKPSKSDIGSAAAIAAYFSKAREQKKVPVSYTQKKYLKKNKKGKPGSVILMREEVIFADPGLPVTT
jgi:predicted ribosome quality control (RQC) complex YloA/Tae2 family protein